MKKLFLLLTGVLICSQTALAARNPVDVWEANSTAEEVLTGEVIEVNSAPSDWGFDEYFTLQVRTISKTTADLAWGDIIRIPFIDRNNFAIKRGALLFVLFLSLAFYLIIN